MAFSWGFNLLDGISKPAVTMASGLEKVEDALHHVDIAIAKAGLDKIKDPLEKQAAGLRIMRTELEHNREAHERFGKKIHETVEHVRNWLEVLYFGKELLKGLAETAMQFGEHIVEDMRFEQGTRVALEAMTGSKQAAIGIMDTVEAVAGRTGINVRSLMDETRELMTAGFNAPLIDKLRPMLADLRAVGPREYGGMTEILRTIGLGAPVSGKAIKTAGLDVAEFNKQLAATKGDTLMAVVNTFSKKYDTKNRGLGAIALDLSKTLPGALDRVKQIPELFANALNGTDSGGPGGIIARALSNLADAFNPGSPSAEHMVEGARSLINSLADAFGFGGGGGGFLDELAGPNGVAKVTQIFDQITNGIRDMVPIVKDAAYGLMEIGKALAWIGRTMAGLGRARQELSGGGTAGQTAWDAALMPKAFEAAGASGMEAQWKLAQNERFTQLARAGDFAGIASEFGGKSNVATRPTRGAGGSMSFHPVVTVNVQGNASREDGEHIAQRVKESLTPFASNVMDLLAQQGGYGDTP